MALTSPIAISNLEVNRVASGNHFTKIFFHGETQGHDSARHFSRYLTVSIGSVDLDRLEMLNQDTGRVAVHLELICMLQVVTDLERRVIIYEYHMLTWQLECSLPNILVWLIRSCKKKPISRNGKE